MKPSELKSAARAAQSTGNIAAASVAAIASMATANPLPIILYGVGAFVWTFRPKTIAKYEGILLEEERKAHSDRIAAARAAMYAAVQQALSQPPFQTWIRRGDLPDYLAVFGTLTAIREDVTRIAHERPEVELPMEQQVTDQLDGLLAAFLKFVRARIVFLQVLAGIRVVPVSRTRVAAVRKTGLVAAVERLIFTDADPNDADAEQLEWEADESARASSRVPFPSAEDRLADMTDAIERLRADAKQRPAVAKQLEARVALLERRRKHLTKYGESDQRIAVQLEAFADAFQLILSHVSSAQFDAGEVMTAMGGVVDGVAETEKYVDDMRPFMGELLGGLDVGSLTA